MSEALNREYFELLGWKLDLRPEIDDDYRAVTIYRLVSPDFSFLGEWKAAPPEWVWEKQIPKLHSDANLCITELDRVFQDWYVRVEHIDDPASEFHGKKTILVTGENFNREKDDWEPSCSGHSIGNFTEAALKCLIAAHKRESEAV